MERDKKGERQESKEVGEETIDSQTRKDRDRMRDPRRLCPSFVTNS